MLKKVNLFILSLTPVLFLVGCASTNQSYITKIDDNTINKSLKICGIGINSEISDIYKLAIQTSVPSSNASFETKFNQDIDTQVMALLKNKDFISKADSKAILNEVSNTRECVLNIIKMTKPKSTSELLTECIDDYQQRIRGRETSTYSGTVKNWGIVKDDGDTLYVSLFVDKGGSSSYSDVVKCIYKNGKYDNVVGINKEEKIH